MIEKTKISAQLAIWHVARLHLCNTEVPAAQSPKEVGDKTFQVSDHLRCDVRFHFGQISFRVPGALHTMTELFRHSKKVWSLMSLWNPGVGKGIFLPSKPTSSPKTKLLLWGCHVDSNGFLSVVRYSIVSNSGCHCSLSLFDLDCCFFWKILFLGLTKYMPTSSSFQLFLESLRITIMFKYLHVQA